jgi:SDR family mycofactocin-dependent oxidoreductase
MGELEGKVAFITGAARGQGRSHAIQLAEAGADIIAVDIAAQIDSVVYPLATPEDLEETVHAVEALGRRIVARTADVREQTALQKAFDDGIAELGRVDIVVANAGIVAFGPSTADAMTIWNDTIAVNLTGVYNTVQVAAPRLIEQGTGGAIVLTSSTQGLTGRGADGGPAITAYAASKHGVVGLMRTFAHWLAPHNVRVNTIHPTGVATPMIINDALEGWLSENEAGMDSAKNLLDIPMLEAADVSNAVLWLVSDRAKYITGVALPVDAGFSAR